jgi:predicted 2-oxoglutarate/Fe(II)-dependent dioxygenase YbiX
MNTYYHKCVQITIADDVFDTIHQLINQYTNFQQAGAYSYDGKNKTPSDRRNSKAHLFYDTKLIDVIEEIIRTVNIEYDWNFHLTSFEETQHIQYNEGCFFNWHIDENNWTPGKNKFNLMRKLSFTILLNDEFTGGEFDVFTTKEQTIPLKKKDMLIFHSDILHQVRPILSGTRYALAGWVLGPPWR